MVVVAAGVGGEAVELVVGAEVVEEAEAVVAGVPAAGEGGEGEGLGRLTIRMGRHARRGLGCASFIRVSGGSRAVRS